MADMCSHIPTSLPDVAPSGAGCVECLDMGAEWVHLRMCVACGHVGCCDDSPHHHALAHFVEQPDHVLMRSFEPGEAWWYCWEDDVGFELEGIGPLRA